KKVDNFLDPKTTEKNNIHSTEEKTILKHIKFIHESQNWFKKKIMEANPSSTRDLCLMGDLCQEYDRNIKQFQTAGSFGTVALSGIKSTERLLTLLLNKSWYNEVLGVCKAFNPSDPSSEDIVFDTGFETNESIIIPGISGQHVNQEELKDDLKL